MRHKYKGLKVHLWVPVPDVLPHAISPNRCLEPEGGLVFPLDDPTLVLLPKGGEKTAEASDADLLMRFGTILPPFFAISDLVAGRIAGINVGPMSLANSLTSTAPSSLLNFSTILCKPYLSTKIARFGCTSQTVLRIRNRLRRTTAFECDSLSMIRLKNRALAMPIVMFVERRVIFKSGSSRFSNELAFAETKQVRRASRDSGFINSSSIRAVSSCNLFRIRSTLTHWKGRMWRGTMIE
jgi:hypothetical protein